VDAEPWWSGTMELMQNSAASQWMEERCRVCEWSDRRKPLHQITIYSVYLNKLLINFLFIFFCSFFFVEEQNLLLFFCSNKVYSYLRDVKKTSKKRKKKNSNSKIFKKQKKEI
jgi:ribosomal protein L24E